MNDQLKQFIDQNRTGFDSESPSGNLYDKIQVRMGHGKKRRSFFSFRYAAMFSSLIAITLGLVLLFPTNKKNPGENKTSTTQNADYSADNDISFIGDPSYGREVSQFQVLINAKQEELKTLKSEYPDLYNQFIKDINQLDSSYQSLKIKLAETPNREMLLEAMIQNLQLQSELLNRQLLIIKEIKQKTKSHAKTDV